MVWFPTISGKSFGMVYGVGIMTLEVKPTEIGTYHTILISLYIAVVVGWIPHHIPKHLGFSWLWLCIQPPNLLFSLGNAPRRFHRSGVFFSGGCCLWAVFVEWPWQGYHIQRRRITFQEPPGGSIPPLNADDSNLHLVPKKYRNLCTRLENKKIQPICGNPFAKSCNQQNIGFDHQK